MRLFLHNDCTLLADSHERFVPKVGETVWIDHLPWIVIDVHRIGEDLRVLVERVAV